MTIWHEYGTRDVITREDVEQALKPGHFGGVLAVIPGGGYDICRRPVDLEAEIDGELWQYLLIDTRGVGNRGCYILAPQNEAAFRRSHQAWLRDIATEIQEAVRDGRNVGKGIGSYYIPFEFAPYELRHRLLYTKPSGRSRRSAFVGITNGWRVFAGLVKGAPWEPFTHLYNVWAYRV